MVSAATENAQNNQNMVQEVEEFPVPEILKPLIDHANACIETIKQN